MKLISHSVSRKGDIVTINAAWRAVNRVAAAVRLAPIKGTDGNAVDPREAGLPVFQGEIKDATGMLWGLAEIAWSMGWRPVGFAHAVNRVIETYKVVPSTDEDGTPYKPITP